MNFRVGFETYAAYTSRRIRFYLPERTEVLKIGKQSRDKGGRGEREVKAILQAHGYDGRRGFQMYHSGGQFNADVMGLPGIHIEVKRTESFRLWDALSQSKADAGENEIPTVWHRKNDCPWVVVIGADDFMEIYKEWEASR